MCAAVTIEVLITGTIVPSAMRDCSTCKFQCAALLKFESHDK